MNEFLQSLRSNSKEKRFNRSPRRNYEGNQSQSYNQRGNQRHKNYGNETAALSHENLEMIRSSLEDIVVNQGYLIELEERKTVAEERKAGAMEKIALAVTKFGNLTGSSMLDSLNEVTEEFASDDLQTEMGNDDFKGVNEKDDVMKIITDMRESGATYDQIAMHLTEKNLPTFSGRGSWHAQTIHRLYQKS
ncbi:MAG: hypothetical protein GY714_05815 [Desulfobacterales bacterium]|nr:hypothetical protein [Desulfobacterales bacterium]MCP4161459.1 hypothetical protein [Deltaproteobacteria bacterium]